LYPHEPFVISSRFGANTYTTSIGVAIASTCSLAVIWVMFLLF
jgi:hypothetical protein